MGRFANLVYHWTTEGMPEKDHRVFFRQQTEPDPPTRVLFAGLLSLEWLTAIIRAAFPEPVALGRRWKQPPAWWHGEEAAAADARNVIRWLGEVT
jgi:hypothetical protein